MEEQELFSKISSAYYQETFGNLRTLSSLGRSRRTARVLRTLDRLIKPASVLADIGCGPGQLASPVTAMGHEYVGVDPNPEMYSLTAHRLRANPKARFLKGCAEEIPLSTASVDAVTCIGVVEYLPDRLRALREIHRILRPNRFAVLTFPSLRNPMSLLREAVRPVMAPTLRLLLPKLRNTVYVSGIQHRTLWPGTLIFEARSVGFRSIERFSDGYYPLYFNHRLLPLERYFCIWADKIGGTLLPGLGSNYYVCLEKH